MERCRQLMKSFSRRKTVDPKKLLISRFKRNLNIFDLFGVGVGGALGIGVYVVITYVIKHQAGPSAVLSVIIAGVAALLSGKYVLQAGPSAVISVIIAGVAALLSGLCYSEYSTRLPQAGSSYVYVYASLGELSAFVVGWSMILENIILAASAAKAWSQYFDGLLNGTVHNYLQKHLYLSAESGLSPYPDLLSCGVLLFTGFLFLFSTKVSTILTFMLTIINTLVIFCIICVGFFHVRHENWTDPPGFFPFGLTGIISGAATLSCIFTVIDTICSSSEETKEPLKIVPSVVITTNILCFVLILCVTSALTLSYPWHDIQDAVAIPHVYQTKGVHGSYYVFSIGGLIGLTGSIITCLHGIPRLLFSMKTDKLLYPCCLQGSENGDIWKLTILPFLLACLLSVFCTLNMLIQILALGTLIAHACIAICVINTRYQPTNIGLYQEYEDLSDDKFIQCTEFAYASFLANPPGNNNDLCKGLHDNGKNGFFQRLGHDSDNKFLISGKPRNSTYQKMESVVNDTPAGSQSSLFQLPVDVSLDPNSSTSMTSSIVLIIFVVATAVFSFIVTFSSESLLLGAWWTIVCLLISVIILIIVTVVIVKQPQNQTTLFFKTPYVPFVPLLSIFLNMLMMSSLSYKAWLRFSVWLFVGLIIYFSYGIRHSTEKEIDDQEVVLYEINEHERTSLK